MAAEPRDIATPGDRVVARESAPASSPGVGGARKSAIPCEPVGVEPGAAIMSLAPKSPGWHASLHLEFEARAGRTVLAHRSHKGPLVVQRPFYPEGDVCHIYLVHPPGGVVGGDTLEVHAKAQNGSRVLITTPAATKFYRSNAHVAHQLQAITLDDATFEWLPQETILFPDAHAKLATRANLTHRSRFIGWEIVCYGRPASGLLYDKGEANQDFEIWIDGNPVVLDHLRLNGASSTMKSPYGLAGHTVLGTMFAFPADDALVALARTAAEARAATVEGVSHACTKVDGVLVCRAAGAHADRVRHVLSSIWSAIRPAIANRPATPPRIWAT